MKSAPTVLALLIGANAQRREDRDHPKPFFQADEILTACVDAAGEVKKKKALLETAEAKKPGLEQARPALVDDVTAALTARNEAVTAVNDYEKADSALDTALKKDDELDKAELDADSDYSVKLFAWQKATATEAAARKAYEDKKAIYDDVVIKETAAIKSETEEKLHQKAEIAALTSAATAEENAIEAYNGSKTNKDADATANDIATNASKLKLYKTAQTANTGFKTAWDDQVTLVAAKKVLWDAAVQECLDVTKLYDDQVKLVGAADAVDSNTYKKVKDANSVAAGAALTTSITPKNGSATTPNVLGVVLANAEIALATEISTDNTKLENSTEYKAWNLKADETVQYYKLFKANAASETFINADATYSGTPIVLGAGTTGGYACATAAAVAATADNTEADCKSKCLTLGTVTGTFGISNKTIPDGDGECLGIFFNSAAADGSKCIPQKTAVPTKGSDTTANDRCLIRTAYKLGPLLFDATEATKTTATLYTNWAALYTSASDDNLQDGTQNGNWETKLKAVDTARAAFDKGRLLEWHYKYLKDSTCGATAQYKKCPDNKPDVKWSFSTPALENASDCGSGKLCFTQPDTFKCYDRSGTNGGDDAGTDTDTKLHLAKDLHDTENAKIAALKLAYDNDNLDAGTFGAAKIAMEAAKKTMDEKIAAHTAQKEEKARQDTFVLQVTKAKEDLTASKGTLDTEAGVTNVDSGLKKAWTTATGLTGDALDLKTKAKEALDLAVKAGEDHHAGADYNTNVTLALVELKKKRDAGDAKQKDLEEAIGKVTAQDGLIADEDAKIKVAKGEYEAQLALCREEKYDDYKKTLAAAETKRTEDLAAIKKLMADNAGKTAAPGSGKEGARCEKARSNGDGRQRGKCGENLCCGAAKGNVAGAVMTIETCQKTDAESYTYVPPRGPMALEDKKGVSWPFACIAGAARVAAAATALATSAYLMA